MLRRIPVSLRFDDEDSEFYYGFIEQKKNDRELSTLILNLLHVYHENEAVRDAVEDYILEKSPFMKIQEEIQRIALEHSRNTVSAGMLDDFTKNAKKSVMEQNTHESQEKQEEKETPMLISAQDMENQVKSMVQSALQEMFKGLQMQVPNVTQSSQIVETVVNEVEKSIPIIENEVSIPVIPEVEIKSEETVEDKDIGIVVDEIEPPKKKPKSFGKLVNSLDNQ